MSFINIHSHDSNGSLLDAGSPIEKVVKRNKELGYKAVCSSNHGTLFSSVKLEKECKKVGVKPIHGIELYISPNAALKTKDNRKLAHLCVLAKNLDGWKELIQINNRANREDFFYYKPRIDLDNLAKYAKNLISYSGHPGSTVCNGLFTSLQAYKGKTEDEVRGFLRNDGSIDKVIGQHQDIFGKDNFFIEISLTDYENFPAARVIASELRKVAKRLNIPCVASIDSHYAEKIDALDQRILLCTSLQTTLKQVQNKLNNDEEFGLDTFFRSNQFYIPSFDEIKDLYTKEELENTVKIGEMCEQYSILNKPLLPKCSNDSVKELREVCRQGWKDKIGPYVDSLRHTEYSDRVKHELDVIEQAGLSDYFLIVRDFIQFAQRSNILVGPGRGSAAGCMVSYLADITKVDPIRFGLIFERFYNSGRNTKDKITFPDIDVDFPDNKRELIVNYIRKKYGHESVAQIVTFGRLMGRGSMRDVCRAYDISFDEINKITEHIPDEAKIADDLQEMKEDGEESSIIMWSLINRPDKFKDWCSFEEGKLKGPLSNIFAQAIRLEGTARSTGKHASGLIISPRSLGDFIPMIHDKSSDELLVGLELDDAEAYGVLKFDILGLSMLSKIETYNSLGN